MSRTYTSIRGIVASDPKIIKDYFNHKKSELFFTLTFITTKADGKKYKVKANIIVKEKTCSNGMELLSTLSKMVKKGDILRLWGYITSVRFYKTKPIKCLRVIKFKYLWANSLLNRTIAENINAYKIIYHPKENKEKVKEFTEQIKNMRASAYFSNCLNKERRYKNQKEKYKALVMRMNFFKAIATKDYKEGDKYNALGMLWINKYIYLNEIPSHARKDFITNHRNLLEADFR